MELNESTPTVVPTPANVKQTFHSAQIDVFLSSAVSCGQLIKQAIVRETDEGLAAKPYVGKDMISKLY